ncbi:hypothetical protein LZG74_19815 [Dyadobacter sp. CY327]|uniref:hypothetical protein n=1 Tax=Dyadobacter sp. CY327 TaxID=2907301 RepID=UPI001F40B17B|nr:hypothetical protein [Dyadobacter sp. CY327]MCE7072573.1 hypothetical protein [Dyadobacter sp. CY327]
MRYNIFNSIHKALRAISYDTALDIQQTNFLDEPETKSAIENLDQTLALLDLHIEHEGGYIHPLVEKYNIDIDRRFREQHIESKFLAQRVRSAVDDLKYATNQENRIKIGKSVSEAFETVLAFNLTLFNKEEHIMNEILWNNYRDVEIMAVEQQIIASVPQDILEFETRWIFRSLNNFEIREWLLGVRHSAPDYLFQSLIAIAEQELPALRFEKLLYSLSLTGSNAY